MAHEPLKGVRIIEFTHAVMGPSCGMILGDLGADVVYVEPPGGSPTRRLKGFGTGYFPYFNRNKRSIALDLKNSDDLDLCKKLIGEADVLIENFAPGTIERLGLGYSDLKDQNPGLIYCSMKGFLAGPYQERTAMDEVVQMMGGLAYMTGPSGRPLRAGTSVIDICGGMFAVIGILSALKKEAGPDRGCHIKSSLFETTAFLMGQHMAWSTLSGVEIPPMPERVSAWSVYQIFQTADKPTFIGLISEKHWQHFCQVFEREEWLERPEYQDNNRRIEAREILLPDIQRILLTLTQKEIMDRCISKGIPFAPIAKPEDLFDDPQLNEGEGLFDIEYPTGERGKLPKLPIEWNGSRLELRYQPPSPDQDRAQILDEWLGK